MNAETRARVEQLLAEAPPLTDEQIAAAVAVLARPRSTGGQSGDAAAFDDPVKLRQAAHIVRASLARQGLTLADLTPADAEPEAAQAARARTAPDTDRRAA